MSLPPKKRDATHLRVLKGVGAHSLGVLIIVIVRIIYPPLFLRAWGIDLYGEWLLLSSAALYLLLADFGGQMYITNRLAEAYAKGDLALFEKLLHTGMAVFILFPLGVFLSFVALFIFIEPSSLLPIVKTPEQVAFTVLTLLALQICISLPQGILMGVYRAVGMLPRSAMLNNLSQLLQLCLVSFGLWRGWGMIGIATMHVFPVVAVSVIAARELYLRHPELNVLSLRSADRRMAGEFVRPSAHFFSIQVSQALTFQSILLVIGAILNMAQVVLFSALRTVINSIRQVLAVFINSIWSEMTRLYARDEPEKLLALFRVAMRTTLVAAVGFIGIFHYFGMQIFDLWLGKSVGYQQLLMDLLLIYVFQFVFWTSCSNLLMSINKHHEISILLLASSVLTIVLAYVGGVHFGLSGVIGGLILADLALPFWAVPLLLTRYIRVFTFMFYIKELLPVLFALSLVVLTPWSTPIVGIGLIVWMAQCLPNRSILSKYRLFS